MPNKSHKYWNVRASAESDTAELTLYGEVLSDRPYDWWLCEPIAGDFIVTKELRDALEPLKAKSHITIKIDSAGGDLYAGIAIYNALKSLTAKKTVIIEGVAMSSASVIAMAGDDIQMYPGSIMMIHGCSFYPFEPLNQEAAEAYANAMNTMNEAMANIYAEKTGITNEEIRAMMKAETWMNEADAIQKGFANTRISGSSPAALSLVASGAGKLLLKNGSRTCTENFKATVPARFGVVLASKQKQQPETKDNMGKQYITKAIAFAKKRIEKAETSFKAEGDISADIEEVKDLVSDIKSEIESSDEDTTEEQEAIQEVEQSLETLETSVSGSGDKETDEDKEKADAKADEDDGSEEDKNLKAIAEAGAIEALKRSGFKASRKKETASTKAVKPNPSREAANAKDTSPKAKYNGAKSFIQGVKAIMKGKSQG